MRTSFFLGYLFILEWCREATIYSDNITVDKIASSDAKNTAALAISSG